MARTKRNRSLLLLWWWWRKKRGSLRRFAVHPINRWRHMYGEYHHLMPQLRNHSEKFHQYLRMTPHSFDHLLELCAPDLREKSTNFCRAVPPEERLVVTLRREKRQAALADLVDQLNVPEDSPSVKVWTFLLNGKPNSVVFHLNTLDVTHNGEEVDTESEFTDGGSKVNFWLGEHTAQIVTEAGASRHNGLVHTLTIDGNIVPE